MIVYIIVFEHLHTSEVIDNHYIVETEAIANFLSSKWSIFVSVTIHFINPFQ